MSRTPAPGKEGPRDVHNRSGPAGNLGSGRNRAQQGTFEGVETAWLRWCDRDGKVIPTGAERAEHERERAERLAERLRALGVGPNEV